MTGCVSPAADCRRGIFVFYEGENMKMFASLEELKEYIGGRVDDALQGEVTEYIKDVIQQHIVDDVYNAYSPTMYARRYDNNGLLDRWYLEDSYYSTPDVKYLFITSNALENYTGKPILGRMINDSGYPNIFNHEDYPWMHPRPFMDNAREEVIGSGVVQDIIKKAIK